jgi:hypothetical protein
MIALAGILLFFYRPDIQASSWDSRTVIKNHLKKHYPWAEIEILDVSETERITKESPEKIHILQGPLGKAVFSSGPEKQHWFGLISGPSIGWSPPVGL